MTRDRTLASAILIRLGIGLAFAGFVVAAPARAQYAYPYGYACPPGYYYDPDYGCVPPGYYYGAPYYAYPGFGFEFFYGPGWGQRWGRYYAPRGVAPHGGGGAPHGGGGHAGGGGHH